jgi:DNA-binding CsgD family transcriptional regulator/tetratricopeptide (TPR) repeat protein
MSVGRAWPREAVAGPLRGRDRELRLLADRVAAVSNGQSGVVLVAGAAGAGKSRLLAEAAELARESGMCVYAAAADPASEVVQFAPLFDALLQGDEPVLDAPVLRELSAREEPRFWLLEELHHRLEQVAAAHPLAIAVDDLQWADAGTLLALRALPARLSAHKILWLLGHRPGAASATARSLIAGGATTIRLGPLSGPAVAAVAQDVLGAPPAPDVLEALRGVTGSPFLLVELLRELLDEGLVAIGDGRARLTGTGARVGLRDHVVAQQVERLSPAAREVLEIASVLGRRFSVDQLSLLLEHPPAGLLPPLRELLSAELLVDDAEGLTFRHELVRDALERALPQTMRRALRRRAVTLMLERDVSPAEVAPLLLEVAEAGDAGAVAALRRAAGEAASTTPDMAATLSRRALQLMPAGDPERTRVASETVALLSAAGRPAEARAVADRALEQAPEPQAEAILRLQLAQVSVQHAGRDVARQSRRALALPGLPASLRLHLRVTRTLGYLMTGAFEEASATAADDLADARADGDPGAEVAALNAYSALCFHRHRYQDALDHADAAQALAERSGPPALGQCPDVWAAWLRSALGRPGEALPRTRAGLRSAQRDGRVADVRAWLACRSTVLLTAGRLSDARAGAEALMATADGLGPGAVATNTAGYLLGRVALHTGDRAAVERAAAAARAMRADASISLRRTGEWLAALIAHADGDTERAMGILGPAVAALGRLAPTLNTPQDPFELMSLLRLARDAGEPAQAKAIAEEIERRSSSNSGFSLHARLARHARAVLDGDGDTLRESTEDLTSMPWPLAAAGLLEDAAGVLAGSDAGMAVVRLDAALAVYSAAGAERDAARVRRRLRELGVRRRRNHRRPASHWGGLTESELSVVQLVAGGATNRETADRLFLSTHTVSTHLRHAFSKLGIRSRVELAVLVARHEAREGATVTQPA